MERATFSLPKNFFEQNASANKPKPLYLFDIEGDTNNQLLFFITDSHDQCWIKKGADWKEVKIKNLLLERDGGSRTYYFEHNAINSLEMPFRKQAYCTMIDKSKILLKKIPLSQEILHEMAIPNLDLLDLTTVPKTKEEVQQKIKLTEEREKIYEEIQKIESIISLLGRAKETMEKLNAPNQESIDLLTNQIKDHKEKLPGLREKRDLLDKELESLKPPKEPRRLVSVLEMRR